MRPAAQYREFAPCDRLKEYVGAFFSFAPAQERTDRRRRLLREVRLGGRLPFAPVLADGGISLAFSFEQALGVDGCWRRCLPTPRGDVIGPMSAAGTASLGGCPESVGVFLRAGRSAALIGVPAAELADRVVAVEDLWGPGAAGLAAEFAGAGEVARIDRLESVLLARLGRAPLPRNTLDVPGMARCIGNARGRLAIDWLAGAAGVSRQHLARVFREAIGIAPKLFARLARFDAGLGYAGRGDGIDWAQAALELGYADQSHMIREFREFGSLTPVELARQRWFHPFIERALSLGSLSCPARH